MKNLLIFTINLVFAYSLLADINLYYVKNVVTVQNGLRFNYSIDYEVKSYNFETGEFSDVDVCNACSKPVKLVKAPLEKWVAVIEYNLNEPETLKKKKELVAKLKSVFELKAVKKDSNGNNILSYYEVIVKENKKNEKKIPKGVKILQAGDTYGKKVIIPPNDNFVLLKSVAVDENGEYFKNNEIKLTSSCGKLKIKDSSRFSFTFFNNENRCRVYAKLGKFFDEVEIIKLNKDGSMPKDFRILYKNNDVDKINIDYYTFKTKGIVLKYEGNKHSVKWLLDGKNLIMQIIDDGIIVYPKKRLKRYKIELINLKNGLTDTIEVILKNE